ncbi:MAG: hypothetical protein INR62_13945, partial [Rhodospirillales bacterium]|nr:hypothetical protein [Acetobacter sp.]
MKLCTALLIATMSWPVAHAGGQEPRPPQPLPPQTGEDERFVLPPGTADRDAGFRDIDALQRKSFALSNDTYLNRPVLEREMLPAWNRKATDWERDGHLSPSTYIWRVVLHDGKGTVYASSQKSILV